MSDINRVTLIGRMVKDPELKHTPSGAAVCSFTLANGRTYTQGGEKQEQTSFFDCVAWNKLSELATQYCKKGQQIAVEGRLQQRTWEHEGNKRSKIEIIAENIQFLAQPKGDGQTAPQHEQGLGTDVTGQVPSYDKCSDDNPFSDDDIPF